MLEVIVSLGIIAFLYAYLYSKSPESRTVSGFAFRLLFLTMSLWTVYLLVWVTYNANTVTEVLKYNETGSYVGKEIWNTTLSQPVKNTLATYLGVTGWIPYLTIALILIFFIYNIFTSILRRRK